MGSHGGGTAAGQAAILAHNGITERSMGVPVRSSMEVVRIGRRPACPSGSIVMLPAPTDRPVNRIKPHTDFSGRSGPGLHR